jgi:predicted site-specific integrase-resolvase
MKVPGGEGAERPRLEGLYARVSGTTGQESSLEAQEAELRATATGTVARVFRDRASGLGKLLSAAADGQVTVVRVTHEDRLARSGVGWLRRLLALHGAPVEVLHPKAQGGREELPEDFVSLVTTFAGRLYGMRSAAARKRLLAEPDRRPPGGVR